MIKEEAISIVDIMTLALEALKDATLHIWLGDKKGVEANVRAHKNIKALEEALAKQEQGEPVAWLDEEKKIIYWHNTHETDDYHGFKRTTPLYTKPQPAQQPWVGLTEKERNHIEDWCEMMIGKPAFDAIEAKLKEKNT
jgi:hypothetical protein